MFQSGKQRELADEQHICENCSLNNDCNTKPEHFGWRYILTYCQRYKEK